RRGGGRRSRGSVLLHLSQRVGVGGGSARHTACKRDPRCVTRGGSLSLRNVLAHASRGCADRRRKSHQRYRRNSQLHLLSSNGGLGCHLDRSCARRATPTTGAIMAVSLVGRCAG